jgi:hypothetical protein
VPAAELAVSLLQFFSTSINVFYPVLTQDRLQDIHIYLDQKIADDELDGWHHPTAYLIFAISLHLMSKEDRHLAALSSEYFKAAISKWQSLKELRRVPTIRMRLLVCIYVVLNPTAGDIWRLLGFLTRMCISMENSSGSQVTDMEREEESMLYRTTFCLEWWVALVKHDGISILGRYLLLIEILPLSSEIAIAFGRPTQLPVFNGVRPLATLGRCDYTRS